MTKKARITIEVECSMPEAPSTAILLQGAFFKQYKKYEAEIMADLLPCLGYGNMNEYCAIRRCPWAKYDEWEVDRNGYKRAIRMQTIPPGSNY